MVLPKENKNKIIVSNNDAMSEQVIGITFLRNKDASSTSEVSQVEFLKNKHLLVTSTLYITVEVLFNNSHLSSKTIKRIKTT